MINAFLTQIKAVYEENKTVSLVIFGIGVAVGAFLF